MGTSNTNQNEDYFDLRLEKLIYSTILFITLLIAFFYSIFRLEYRNFDIWEEKDVSSLRYNDTPSHYVFALVDIIQEIYLPILIFTGYCTILYALDFKYREPFVRYNRRIYNIVAILLTFFVVVLSSIIKAYNDRSNFYDPIEIKLGYYLLVLGSFISWIIVLTNYGKIRILNSLAKLLFHRRKVLERGFDGNPVK